MTLKTCADLKSACCDLKWPLIDPKLFPSDLISKNSFSIHPMHLRGHVEHALRELDTQTRSLVDEFIQKLQHEIVRVARL